MAVALRGDVLPLDEIGELFAQLVREEEIAGAQRFLHILVGVHGADAAARGAELLVRETVLFENVHHLVVRHADRGTVADLQMLGRDFHALSADVRDFLCEVFEIEHHAGAEDVHRAGAQNTGRQQIENEFAALVHDGVPGVVSALITDNDLMLGGKKIDHAALSLVAPVDSNNSSKHLEYPPCFLDTHRNAPGDIAAARFQYGINMGIEKDARLLRRKPDELADVQDLLKNFRRQMEALVGKQHIE